MPISLRSQLGGGAGITPNAAITSSGALNTTTDGQQIIGFNQLTNLNINTLTTVLQLNGKFAISSIVADAINSSGNNAFRLVMIVDGVTVCDQVFTGFLQRQVIFGTPDGANARLNTSVPLICKSSFTLRLQNTGNTNAGLRYNAIPIE